MLRVMRIRVFQALKCSFAVSNLCAYCFENLRFELHLWNFHSISVLTFKVPTLQVGTTYSRPLFVFWKSFIWGKSKCSAITFNILRWSSTWPTIIKKLYKTLGYWLRDKLNFDFLEQGLGIVSSPHFGYNFSWKMFLLLLEILDNICIPNICFPVCDLINPEINLIFIIKPFLHG